MSSSSESSSQEIIESQENEGEPGTPKKFRLMESDDTQNGNLPRTPLRNLPASPAMQRLGYGTGVSVYTLERSPSASGEVRSPWAIKKISSKTRGNIKLYERRLTFEAEILKKLKHPNIIGYRAFRSNLSSDVAYLAMEKASKSLTDLIEERAEELMPLPGIPFPATEIYRVALDVAQALAYLHEEQKLLHGDVKSANVLIFGNFEIAKLCDFGVARTIKEDGVIEGQYVGTELYFPSEVLLVNSGKEVCPVTSKADIYPYGLTVHEMVSLKPPHLDTAEDDFTESLGKTASDNNIFDEFKEQALNSALQQQLGRRPSLPDFGFDDTYTGVLKVFSLCTEQNPDNRPTAKQILSILHKTENRETSHK